MRIILDIDCGMKDCGNCKHLVRNLPVQGFCYGIPIKPTCMVFGKPITGENKELQRLDECLAANVIKEEQK
jgi:hypothetical protein